MPVNIQRQAMSEEVLQVTVYSPVDLDAQPVEMAIIPAGTEPTSSDFAAVSWVGDVGPVRTAQKDADTYGIGDYDVYVTITDNQIPVLYAGRMLVV